MAEHPDPAQILPIETVVLHLFKGEDAVKRWSQSVPAQR
jgi:hypothetical protein